MERRHLHLLFEFDDAAERTGASGFTPQDIGAIAWQKDNDTFWMLKDVAPTWVSIRSANPTYAVVTTDATPTVIYSYAPVVSVVDLFMISVYAVCPAENYAALYAIIIESYLDRSGTPILDSFAVNELYEDRVAWNVTGAVNGANIEVSVTGEAGLTINWLLTVQSFPVTGA